MTTARYALAVCALISAPLAGAHHAFAPVYDGNKTVTITGVVTAFHFVNPHASMTLDVADGTDKAVTWTIEFDGRLNLTNKGWTDSSVKVGEHIKVTGNPTHTGSPRLFFVELTKADGTLLQRFPADRAESLEQERRERIERRAK
jgi:hypothetical protein